MGGFIYDKALRAGKGCGIMKKFLDRMGIKASYTVFPGFSFIIQIWLFVLAAVLLCASMAVAKPTTSEQARSVVQYWLAREAAPMGARLGGQIKRVQTFNDSTGTPAYYVVYLNPAGMVFLPADDLVEPIIGFMPGGIYDPSDTNPLGALVSRDLPGRVLQARALEAKGLEPLSSHTPQAKARRKWDWLQNLTSGLEGLEAGYSSISDVRVAPFVQSHWSQETAGGNACYNYYTPPYGAGNASNFPSGCVATAMAQLMRYYQYPVNPLVGTFNIYVGPGLDPFPPFPQSATIRGGNGSGGNYDWTNMTLDPSGSTGESQRAAIGALAYDAGVSVNMWYQDSDSGTDTLKTATAFKDTFRYSNAKTGFNNNSNLPATQRNNMVNPNLHAKYPILFGITNGESGHAIVCDGYGYNSATMYHHLNLGWAGSNDAWYNLPVIDTSVPFDTVHKCVYNVYTTGSGEIIAGRVTTSGGAPLNGVAVTATRIGGGTYNALTPTDANGIYAITKVPSASSYTVGASKAGYTFISQSASTGISTDRSTTAGNLWQVDFAAGRVSSSSILMLLLD